MPERGSAMRRNEEELSPNRNACRNQSLTFPHRLLFLRVMNIYVCKCAVGVPTSSIGTHQACVESSPYADSWMATARPDGSAAQPQSARGIQRTAVLAAASDGKCCSKI